MSTTNKILLTAIILTAMLGIALAGNVNQIHGEPLYGTRDVAAVDAIAAINSTNYCELPTPLNGRRNIHVTPHLSGSGASCKIAIALGTYQDGLWKVEEWVESGTLTASSTWLDTTGGLYLAPGAEFVTANWTHFKIHVTVLSTGTGRVKWSAY